MNKHLNLLSVIVGGLAYLNIIFTTMNGAVVGLSVSTFLLWSLLAAVTIYSLCKQKVNPAIACVYGSGATIMTIILLFKGKYSWDLFDTFIAAMVMICVILYFTTGPKPALVFSSLSGFLASLPFIVLTWSDPINSPIVTNSGFLLANVFAFAGAKAWTLEDRIYSGVNMIGGVLLVFPWFIK